MDNGKCNAIRNPNRSAEIRGEMKFGVVGGRLSGHHVCK